MTRYLFFLGQNKPLAIAELKAIFPAASLGEAKVSILPLSTEEPLSEEQFCRLGGSIKVAQEIAEYQDDSDLKKKLLELLKDTKNFSLTFLASQSTKDLSEQIKDELLERHIARYLLAKDSTGLSPVALQKKKVTEIFVDPKENRFYKTVWSHNFRHWIARDRNKPYVTPKLGMLPPKLARIMVNLGIADKDPKGVTLLDPFCGTGTVLMEASLLGISVIGSDLSPQQVTGTNSNMKWLPKEQSCAGSKSALTLLVADATHISKEVSCVDTIVTEPTLGPPNPRLTQITGLQKGLQKLYIGAFKDWINILPPKGRIVFCYPIFTASRQATRWVAEFIDTCENLGYNCLQSDLDFTREGASIIRRILLFEKK